MNDSIRLGRILGIPVGLNWTTLVIGALIAYSLAATFPAEAPGAPAPVYWALGVLATVLFFASLLAHELAHAVVARRRGMQVEGITLWLFGGVSKIHDDAHDPAGELRMAVVGPLTSIVIGIVALGVTFLMIVLGASPLWIEIPSWLAAMNVILGVFNLLPAFPLDGGRVLRAFLWRRRRDQVSATVTAAGVGRVFGWLLMSLGLVEIFYGSSLGGIWLVCIGWFLTAAASAEAGEVLTRTALSGVTVREVMTPEPLTAPDWITVEALVQGYLLHHPHAAFPVHDMSGTITGLMTLNRARMVPAGERGTKRLREVCTPLAETVRVAPETPLNTLRERLMTDPERRALVFEGEALVGIVSPSDIAFATAIRTLGSAGRRRSA